MIDKKWIACSKHNGHQVKSSNIKVETYKKLKLFAKSEGKIHTLIVQLFENTNVLLFNDHTAEISSFGT